MCSVLCVQCVCERERDRGRECMYVSDVYNVKRVQKGLHRGGCCLIQCMNYAHLHQYCRVSLANTLILQW